MDTVKCQFNSRRQMAHTGSCGDREGRQLTCNQSQPRMPESHRPWHGDCSHHIFSPQTFQEVDFTILTVRSYPAWHHPHRGC